jgi:glycosyltransferase involved in cell wall biosynthesis
MIEGDANRLRILYVQAIELDSDLCRTSRLGLSAALAERGCQVTLVAGFRRQRPNPPRGVELIAIRLVKLPYARALFYAVVAHATVFRLLMFRSFDVAVLDPYTFLCGWPFDWLSRIGMCKTHFVLDVRSGVFHTRTRPLADALRRRLIGVAFGYARRVFSGFTTISPMLQDIIATEHHVRRDRIGIWESAVAPDFGTGGLNSTLPSLPEGRFVVLYHGSFGPDRGLEETVDAMRLLEVRRPDVLLLLLGGGTEEQELRRRATGLENVRFVSTVPHDEVASFIRRCDVGILPFRPTPVMRSSRPLKLMEYVVMGKPVIVTPIEAFTGVLSREAAVFLREHSPEGIADAIVLAAEQRHALTRDAQQARSIASERYTWRHQADALCDFLAALS